MTANVAHPPVDGFELPGAEQTCRIYSRRPVQWVAGEHHRIAVIGQVSPGSTLGSLEGIAAALDAGTSLQDIYDDIEGSFCLVIANLRTNALQLVSDFLGLQTCYFTVESRVVLLSDSLDLLRRAVSTPFTHSDQSIYDYFYFHCIPAPGTIYNECAKMEPGKALTFERGQQRDALNLYKPQFASTVEGDAAMQERCLAVIDEAVATHAVDGAGAFLSGGLDSSTVAGMLARHHQTARTFSVGFHLPDYDETPYAQLTAAHFGTQHEVFYLEADEAATKLVEVAQYFEEPFGNSSAMAAYFCARYAKSRGVDTLLAGDGGDELFAGNPHYGKQRQFELFFRLPAWLRGCLRLVFDNTVAEKLPLARKAASYIRQADIPLPDRLGTYNFVQLYGAPRMFNPDFLARVDAEAPLASRRQRYFGCSSDNAIDRMLYLDWKFTLADNDLVKVKKMCEMAGVEVRFPLLERSVVDFSCEVPADVKMPGYNLREFYKDSCRGFLPDDTLSKSKHGFGLPFGLWMKENASLQALSRECVDSFRQRRILSDALIDDAIKSHETVHASYYGELIWIIVILELWLQREPS